MKKAGRNFSESVRIFPQNWEQEGSTPFSPAKMGLGIYRTTLYFLGPLTCKKPRFFLGFLGWHLF